MQFTRPLAYQMPLVCGQDVQAVQQALIAQRLDPPCGDADGIFGAATAASVRVFQQRDNLAVTGTVDAQTWAELMSGAAKAGATAANVMAAARPLVAPAGGPKPNPPLNAHQAAEVKTWMRTNFAVTIDAAIAGVAGLDSDLVCAIACKESAIYWVGKISSLPPADILRYCVFDASGDFPGTTRHAFPVNAAALRADPAFGALTDMLIQEANNARAGLRGYGPAEYLYKGYGIFQYDLQNIRTDVEFFRDKLWYGFDACMDRFMREMRAKLTASGGDIRLAVRMYNGSGPAAEQYAADVMQLAAWCAGA